MSICLVHLIRKQNGLQAFRNFLDAYGNNSGGIKHTLLLLGKGFDQDSEFNEYREILDGSSSNVIFLPDRGFDIVPYFRAVEETRHEIYCFVNSFAEPLDADWLSKLHRCLQGSRVGLVGATGSWGSLLSHAMLQCHLLSAYEGLFRLVQDDPIAASEKKPLEVLRKIRRYLGRRKHLWLCKRYFLPFPAYHIRTNAFMIRRETMLQIHCGPIHTKTDAMRFESGRRNMTLQVLSMGLRALIVGRDGQSYEKENWPRSNTFWQADQGNLLVADNQTKTYDQGNAAQKSFHAHYAWGNEARP